MTAFSNNHSEGPVAKAIESQTSKLPSDFYLWAAIGAMAASATLKLKGKSHTALFVGQWAAPLLLFGIYNKIVKTNSGHAQDGGQKPKNHTTPQERMYSPDRGQ